MKVRNIHCRLINAPMTEVGNLLLTLATEEDLLWPIANWPPMRFKSGVVIGSRGGHGPIRYFIDTIIPGESIEFQFEKPEGFNGVHGFKLEARDSDTTLLTHYIEMKTSGKAIFSWWFLYRPLHNALIEDCLTNAEVNLGLEETAKKWNLWVRFLRKILS